MPPKSASIQPTMTLNSGINAPTRLYANVGATISTAIDLTDDANGDTPDLLLSSAVSINVSSGYASKSEWDASVSSGEDTTVKFEELLVPKLNRAISVEPDRVACMNFGGNTAVVPREATAVDQEKTSVVKSAEVGAAEYGELAALNGRERMEEEAKLLLSVDTNTPSIASFSTSRA